MATENQQLADGAVDPNVVLPKHIREQSAAADSLHKQVYTSEATPPAEPDATNVDPQPQPQDPPAPQAQVQDPPQQQQAAPLLPPLPPTKDGTKETNENHESWHHAFLSMQGRWQASERNNGALQETLNQMAAELQATQNLLEQNRSQPRTTQTHQVANSGQTHEKLITPQDVDTYGQEMIDVVQRAAREAVGPEIDALRGENAELKKRVITTGQREVQLALARDIPNWVAINRSSEFANWLNLRNPYTQQLRRQMLNSAYAAANAPVVVQLFKDFLMEAKATGSMPPAPQHQQQDQQQQQAAPAPRAPAVSMETLAAPGRARPAPGDNQVPAEKPIYTHAQIRRNYDMKRRGAYAGRDAEWNALETDMIAAPMEGRVR
jgi:hypothetical protein